MGSPVVKAATMTAVLENGKFPAAPARQTNIDETTSDSVWHQDG
jgi:hypothetical protein